MGGVGTPRRAELDVCSTQTCQQAVDGVNVPTAPRRSFAVVTTTLAFALAPAAQAHAGLLDGLLGGGSTPTPTAVSPSTVTNLVTQLQLLGTPGTVGGQSLTTVVNELLEGGLPATVGAVQTVLPDLTSALAPGGTPTALVGQLLSQGVSAVAIIPIVDQLLATVADPTGAVNAVVGQLLAVGLPTDTTALSGVLAALQGGALPTGTLLAPVAGVLDALAANEALPAEVRATVAGLSTTVKATGDSVLGTDLLEQVSGILGTVGGALGTGSATGGLLGGLAGLLPPKATTTAKPTTTTPVTSPVTTTPTAPGKRGTLDLKDLTAVVSSLKVDKARKVAKIKVSCPARSFVPCTVKTAASVDGLRSGKAVKTTLKAGQAKTLSIKLPSTKTRKLSRRGGRLSVRAVTSYAGYQLGTASKAIKVAKAAKKR